MLFSNLKEKNSNSKIQLLSQMFSKNESVLDFGCGDLSMAKGLKKAKPKLSITGVDVIKQNNASKNISYVQYDGRKLPFANNSFDTVIAFYVFHHCPSAEKSFKECARVAKKRIIVVESVARHPFELPFMCVVDWMYNIWKPEPMPLTYQFLSQKKWEAIFEQSMVSVQTQKKIIIMPQPAFLPVGVSYLYILRKVI